MPCSFSLSIPTFFIAWLMVGCSTQGTNSERSKPHLRSKLNARDHGIDLKTALSGRLSVVPSVCLPLSRSVLDFGAVRDGVTLCTDAIQQGIQACAELVKQTHQRCNVVIPPVRINCIT
eukprot:6556043-Pyramimonas_sp.AAC.1